MSSVPRTPVPVPASTAGDAGHPAADVAIVGLAVRFPQAPDLDAFWRLLREGGDAIGPVPADRWDAAAQLDPELSIQAVGGFLDNVYDFDPTFFGISPREAAATDPQHRLTLETSWRALEDAGVRADLLARSRTGVYVGTSWRDFEILRKERGAPPTPHAAFGTAPDVISARLAYFLRLTGPSLTVETGCSSSLVALHLAVQALRSGEIDAALVAGVNLILIPDGSIGLTHFGGLSPTGRSRAFAADADGFVRGEGVAVAYLKPLAAALADGDRIRGVIRRTAVNNDGGGESLVTPNPAGQEDLLEQVYHGDGLSPDDVAYIEAHGTGTRRGDPVEAEAIGRIVGQRRSPGAPPLGIGSVKTNVGHLEPAAGMAGLAKAVLALEHGVVPPSLHAQTLNPELDFAALNLAVTREPLPLPADGSALIGVNSFGWGGTNAHVVVSGPPPVPAGTAPGRSDSDDPRGGDGGGPVVLALSAPSSSALARLAGETAAVLRVGTASPRTVAGALAHNRAHFPQRLAVVAAGRDPAIGIDAAAEILEAFAAGDLSPDLPAVSGRAGTRDRTAFVFPGQGSQWRGMGRELYAAGGAFRATLERCAQALRPHVDWDLVDVVTGAAEADWPDRVDVLQPVLWAVTVALAEAWRAAGIEPDVVVGHSQGEVSAATVAGILSYEDAAKVVATRAALVRRLSGRGGMLAVDLGLDAARAAMTGFEDSVSVAVNNGPRSCVLSGDVDALELLRTMLEADGVFCRRVNVDYASHSPHMDELRDELLAALGGITPGPGDTALMSTVTGEVVAGERMDAAYWTRNLRCPVLFADAMNRLFDDGVTHVVEISPHPVLGPPLEELAGERPEPPRVLTTLRRDAGAPADLALAEARAYVGGLEPFGALRRQPGLALPGQPWDRATYDVPRRRARAGGAELSTTLWPSAEQPDVWTGSFELTRDDPAWLRDHRVFDAVVMPATGMLAAVVNAAVSRTGAVPAELRDVEFEHDLTLGDQAARVGLVWTDDGGGGAGVTLSSLGAGAPSWTTHLRARARLAGDGPLAPALAAPTDDAGWEPVDVDAFYEESAARGLVYGPAFRGLTRLRRSGRQAEGRVELTARCQAGARAYPVHPALWDAALQVALAVCPGDQTLVPRSVGVVELAPAGPVPPRSVWSRARLTTPAGPGTPDAQSGPDGGGAQEVTVEIVDDDGALVLRLVDVRLAPLPAAPATQALAEQARYRMSFGEHTPDGPPPPALGPVCVVPLSDASEAFGRQVASGLASAGRQVVPGTVAGQVPAAATLEEVVVVAPGRGDGLAAAELAATLAETLMALVRVVRACAARPSPPRVVLVTRNAQCPDGADEIVDPAASAIWGFGRVARREHPELRVILLDVDGTDAGCADEVARAALADEVDQVVIRGGAHHAGRLVSGTPAGGPPPPWRRTEPTYRLVPVRPGAWDGCDFLPLTRRPPAAGEVELAVEASALNFVDVMKVMGTYPDTRGGALLGTECAGVVTRVGPGVEGLAVGDRLVACAVPAIATHVTVRRAHTRPVPAGLSTLDAVTLPTVLATVWFSLVDVARVRAGETVLIHSAAGGVGLAAVQVARLLGAEVLATAGSERKRRHLRDLGIAHVFDSRSLDWARQVRDVTGGRGVDVVLNSLTGAAITAGLDVLAERGRFVEVGKKDIYGGRMVSLSAFRKGISMTSVDLASLATEEPDRFAQVLADSWARVETDEIAPLPALAYSLADAGEAVREMSRGAHIGKFVLDHRNVQPTVAPEARPDGRYRSAGTYLISGGLGALGLSLAEHLADAGAGALLLLGRRGPDEAAAGRVERLRGRGVDVRTLAADVADRDSLAAALAGVRATVPPLRGVFHAAGVLDDATIGTVTAEKVARVLAPKTAGAVNLDAVTPDDPLDLFVLFSSAAALVGNTGQAVYAAANSFLDGFARRRRAEGRPALSVQWGPFADIGLAAIEANRGARLADRGMIGFDAASAWAELDRLHDQGGAVAAFMPLDLRQWFDSYPDTAALRSWSGQRAAAENGTAPLEGNNFVAGLLAADGERRQAAVEARVRELVNQVLRLNGTAVAGSTPFKSLGLDSLMSLELRNRLEAVFARKLSPTLLWTYGTVDALTGALSELVFSGSAEVNGDGR